MAVFGEPGWQENPYFLTDLLANAEKGSMIVLNYRSNSYTYLRRDGCWMSTATGESVQVVELVNFMTREGRWSGDLSKRVWWFF